MQRIRFNGIKDIIIWLVLPILAIVGLIVLDQLTKFWFTNLFKEHGNTTFIKGFLSFTYTVNTGSAFSFLANKDWAQTFFKIFTFIALIVFVFALVYSIGKRFKTLSVSLVLIISGTIGNLIDRLVCNGVTDFIRLDFINFPIFNLADMLLTFGVIIFIVHYFFLDKNAVFKKQPKEEKDKND